MAEHNDFVNLYNNTDWLDKPHFPFWITATSLKILGVNSFRLQVACIPVLGNGYLLFI
jgi:4-amino-4-deoxy-L-arabinose transferase-like glycosyltransferase